MNNDEQIARLTKEEYNFFSFIFTVGVYGFLDIFEDIEYTSSLGNLVLEQYISDKVKLIRSIAKKFDINIERILKKYEM